MLVTAIAAHVGGWGFGFHLIPLILITLFWIGLIVLILSLARRRGGWGDAHHGQRQNPGRNAEVTLAERFANGDIDEKEYRARLEVLRALA